MVAKAAKGHVREVPSVIRIEVAICREAGGTFT